MGVAGRARRSGPGERLQSGVYLRTIVAAVGVTLLAGFAAGTSARAGTRVASALALQRLGGWAPALGAQVVKRRGRGALVLPDLRIFVPTDLISLGLDASSGERQLRFTHITADVGAGPFEIDPSYSAATGTATFTQMLYRSPRPGVWVADHSVPVAAVGNWRPPSDYQFALTRFTLNRVNPDGTPGAVMATSPKTDYCITGDTRLNGIPNTPEETYIPQSDCTDPTAPLGWSVGWADQYDQTDAGQPIDLTGVPDGTYVLHAEVDPRHVLTESNTADDVTDTTLRIAGDQVTVVAQHVPNTVLPTVRVTAPAPGTGVAGTVIVRASTAAAPGTAIVALQFLLDGRPIGRSFTRPPFVYSWTVGRLRAGRHYLSAEVTDSQRDLATARSIPVVVPRPSSLTITRLRWRGGRLTMLVRGVARGESLLATLRLGGGRTRAVMVRGASLSVRVARPRLIVLSLWSGRHPVGRTVAVSLENRPTILIINPTSREVVSGIVPLAALVDDGALAVSLRFYVDGRRVGPIVTNSPYSVHWDTRALRSGLHRLTALAINAAGNAASVRVRVRVRNPAPPMTCFVLQAQLTGHGQGTITTAGFHTAAPGELLLAFVAADGPAGSRSQTARVTGAGLHWRLVGRANLSAGDSEVWVATATKVLAGARVGAMMAAPGFDGSLTVAAVEGADGIGAVATGSGPSGAPGVKLRTLAGASLVFAVGNDWDRAIARVLPTGWVRMSQWLDSGRGNTFWTQYTNQTTGRAGSVVDARALAPSTDRWNLVAVELLNSGD